MMNRYWVIVYVAIVLVFIAANPCSAQTSLPNPADVGDPSERLDRIDEVVKAAIERGNLPGAVVLVVHRDRVVFRRAYGLRSKMPTEIAMTEDTVFDLASLTKPMATATALMLLVEQGKVRVSDPVSTYLPAFAAK